MFPNRQKKKRLVMRTFAMVLFMALFTQFAQAQTQILKMTNGTRQVTADGFLFYDSGGPLLFNPATDPDNANEYNWTTWYQHNEEYTMTLTVPEGNGIQVEFTKMLINNDTLKFYEGNSVNPDKLIGVFCNNEYSTSFCSTTNPLTVTSHGNMTIQFISDYHWRDEGWEAEITQTSAFVPQPPVAVMDNCNNLVMLIPTCIGATTNVIEYKIGSGSYTEYTPGAWIDLNSETFPVSLTVKATVDGNASAEKAYTFSRKIQAPNTPIYTLNTSSNSVTTYFPVKPAGVNDTYYIRWTINSNSNGATENPNLWTQSGHEFQQPSNTPNSVPAGVIDYTNAGLTPPFYVHIATRGTTCDDIFSNVITITINELCVPMPTITFVTNPSTHEGATTLACAMTGVTIYYTTDGSIPTTSSNTYSGTFNVTAGTTVKAIAVKTGFKISDVASDIFVPGGESGTPQNGVYGGVVLLDDRENHSWSYYSDETSPIKSLNPADVKITYTGYGTNTMTSTNPAATGLTNADFNANVTSSQVAVNVGSETENQFIYLKTLEKDQNTNNAYPYTMIPNPFQKRPTYTGSKGEDANGELAKPSLSTEVRDRNGNVVAQSANGNKTESMTSPDRSTEMTRAENTLLTQNFDAMTSIATSYSATGWYAYNAGNGNNWAIRQESDYANSGSNSVYVLYNSTYAANCYLVSEPFNVSSNMTELNVSLFERVHLAAYAETFEVFFVKTSDVTNLAGVASATPYNAIASADYTNITYQEVSGSVTSSTLAGESVRVVVHCTSAADKDALFIDDITVTETTSGGSGGTTVWAETTTITPGEEYLIGFSVGSNVYLAVNYAVNETNHYYYTSVDANYYGYTALASIDGNGYVTGVSGYATNLQYCTWKFSTSSGGIITSGYESGRYLYGWTSSSTYHDLYPNTTSQTWTYTSANGRLSNGNYYADYLYSSGPHMQVTSSPSYTVKLYTKQTLSVPCTVTAVAGTGISTAYVNEGSTPSGTSTSVNTTTGSTVTFQATASSGYAFSGWYNGSTLVSTNNPYTCTATGDLTLTAQAVPAYTVTAAAGTGISTAYVAVGTSFSGTSTSVTVAQGGSATFQATLASDYVFDGWYDQSDNRVSANLTYTATNIQGNFTLTAKGSHTYNIYITAAGGTVTASPNPAQAGQSITLTLTPSGSYQLGALTVTNDATGEEITLSGSGNTRTFTMPASTVTVNATFYDPTQTYRGFYAWRVKSLSNGLEIQRADGTQVLVGGMINADEDIKFVTNSEEGNEVEFEALWAQAWVTTSTNIAGLNPNVSYERNFMVLGSNPGTINTPTYLPSESGTSTNSNGRNVPLYINRAYGYGYSISQQIYTAAEIGASGDITAIGFRVQSYASSNRTLHIYMSSTSKTAFDYNSNWSAYQSITVSSASQLVYSGTVNFNSNGWKTITLNTPFEYDGTSNILVTVFDATGTYMSTSPRFYTYSGAAVYNSSTSAYDETGYYYAMNQSSYKPQIQFTFTSSTVSGLAVPLTMTTRNPDGTGGSTTVTLTNTIKCGADLKIENIKMNALPLLSANGHDLVVGRGVTPSTSGGICASYVNGLLANATSPSYRIRLESGRYEVISMVDGYYQNESSLTISGTPKVSMVLGSDYDRASEKYEEGDIQITEALDVTTSVAVGRGLEIGSTSMVGEETFKAWVKSGKICSSYDMSSFNADFAKVLYMSSHGSASYAGYRKLFIEGGEISSVAGGMDDCNPTKTNTHVKTFTARMTNGHIRSALFGGASQVPSGGDKEIIVTGGVVTGWIGAGCNGTADSGGQTYGEGFIYFGGDAVSGGEGSSNTTNGAAGGYIFGAGNGRATATTSGEMTFGTNVVIADQCDVEHDVYGGGNYGYSKIYSKIYVLGGTVHGNVFGGANQKKGPATFVTMKDGIVEGNLYGGSNVTGKINASTTINYSGGTANNIYGGGLGESTHIASGTNVNVTGGSLNGNVYGGGQLGTVSGNTNVSIQGGTVHNVFGAGKGNSTYSANISGNTNVIISGGTVDGSVYGGGEEGTVSFNPITNEEIFEDFENGLPDGWVISDNDGDGYSWFAYGGTMISQSYDNTLGVLTPDNWLISNQVPLGGSVSFYAEGVSSYPAEVFAVYLSTTSQTSGFTKIGGDYTATGTYTKYEVDLSAYSGMGYIAIRHYNCTDQFYLTVDDFTVNYDVTSPTQDLTSTVSINGGTINEDVFGGGRLGKTDGDVIVNVFDGNVTGNVYGGAFGRRNEVFINGTHTVNVTGGNMYGNVYGGSRNADDALTSDHTGYTMSETVCRVNISGGHVYYNVFASGYFGHTYGSVYAFIGQNAINNAPNHQTSEGVSYNAAALLIDGTVYAGADFGNFDGTNFGAETIEGYSNVYIDGTNYNTTSTSPSDAGYMNIGGSVLGVGTSCYAGKLGHDLIFRNYGQPVENPAYGSKEAIIEPYTTATRNLLSIQFFDNTVIDNCHIHFIGQGRVNSLLSTEKYALYEMIDVLRIVNGSSLFIDYPVDQMKKLGSYTCADVYANSPSYTVVDYSDLGPNNGKDNKFRVNNGSYLNVKYLNAYGEHMDYGELEGFFYMMTEDENNTCAYARPKQSTDAGNTIPDGYNNPNDGGFLSYDATKNTYNISGGTANPGVQMPYENHTLTTKYGELYFRIWRYGGIFSYREGVFDAVASTTPGYSTADVVISLPAQHGTGSYFRIKTENGFPLIDYGDDVMTVNAGVYSSTNNTPNTTGWMYYDATNNKFVEENEVGDVASTLAPLSNNPNVNFGLVAIPQGSLAGAYNGNTNNNWLICNAASDAGEALTTERWYNTDNVTNPSILFRLTYNNELTNNATWDPITIILEQYDAEGHLQDEITVALSVSINTTINQDFSAETFAMMNGQGGQADIYTAKVVLPGFIPYVNTEGDLSNWTFVSAVFTPADGFTTDSWVTGSNYVHNPAVNNEFSMQIVPAANYDNTVGWSSYDHTVRDLHTITNGTHLAYTDGRNPTAFDFILHYDGRATCPEDKRKMGELEVTLHFTNITSGTGPDYGKDLTITIEVYRRGKGSNYYLDGVNGDNFFAGDCPDAAKKTLSGIFNRTEYTPGDNIFIVNTVTADGATTLDWNGEEYGEVVLYRYPGGHALKKDDPDANENDYYAGYSTSYNPYNTGFTGTLVKVKRGMAMHGIVLDGAYDIVHASTPDAMLVPDASKYQDPIAPMVDIEANGVLNVYAQSKLQWNYTNSNGGAVYNAGKMIIRGGSDINNNAVLANTYKGAGVFVKDGATLIVSDSITINDNHLRFNDGSKAIVEKNSNVYLEGVNSVIQVGTVQQNDGILALENHLTDGTGLKSAKIGVTKAAWPDYYYNPIAYSDGGGSAYLGNIIPADAETTPAEDYIIFDDDEYYKLVTLNNTTGYEPSTDYLFWVGTWVTSVRTEPAGYDPNNIDTPEELAWAISVVNGLNTITTAVPNQDFNITGDIDMNANIWVPMGTEAAPYTGTFNGNGHVIKGVKSSLNSNDMGMFANLNGTIENMILNVSFTGGNSIHMGSVAAHMNGGSIHNVEAAGVITGTSSTESIGGIVAEMTLGTIHSSFAVNTMSSSSANTYVGGLVGNNGGDLINSYANTAISGSGKIGGLVGNNSGRVENCYSVIGSSATFPAFAYENANSGVIKICYTNNDEHGFVFNPIAGSTLEGHGTYSNPLGRKAVGYMYADNVVTLVSGQSDKNDYVSTALAYNTAGTQIEKWPGLLSALNQWVKKKNSGYAPWFRPTSSNINGDLPILAFPSDNCLGTTDADGKYLAYGSIDNSANGLDNLLYLFNENVEDAASSLFLYGNANNVTRVPENHVKVFINEDAALIQSGNGQFKNATVGVTFDNSSMGFGNSWNDIVYLQPFTYDWHFLSSPLENASIGIEYTDENEHNWWDPGHDNAQVASVSGSYFPDDVDKATKPSSTDPLGWDIYTFFEPQYHWINLKRNSASHFHFDEPHLNIVYENETVFEPGKGYMMAIGADSYMSNTGTLTNKDFTVNLTARSVAPGITEKGCNFLGNPYHAYFDLNAFFNNATNEANGINCAWVYIAEQNNYVPYLKSASSNPITSAPTLHPHQGFFVKVTSDCTAQFTKSMATTTSDGAYYRGEQVNYPLVNLFAYNEEGQRDFVVVEFNRPDRGGATKMTARNNAPFRITAQDGQEEYTILFTDRDTKRIPIRFVTTEDGTYTLKWDTYHGTFSKLTLIDNITGGSCDMTVNDHYTFDGHATDFANRFYLIVSTTDVDEFDADNNHEFAYFNGSEWMVNGQGQLDLIDMTGRVLYSKYLPGESNSVSFGNVAAGVYVLRFGNKAQKIVIKK